MDRVKYWSKTFPILRESRPRFSEPIPRAQMLISRMPFTVTTYPSPYIFLLCYSPYLSSSRIPHVPLLPSLLVIHFVLKLKEMHNCMSTGVHSLKHDDRAVHETKHKNFNLGWIICPWGYFQLNNVLFSSPLLLYENIVTVPRLSEDRLIVI